MKTRFTFLLGILLPLGGELGLGCWLLSGEAVSGRGELGHHHVLHPLRGQPPDGVYQQLGVFSGQLVQKNFSLLPVRQKL